MNKDLLKLDLQLFADDGSAGGAPAGIASGESAGGAQTEGMSAASQSEGVTAQPQREGSRDKIFPRVQRIETTPARPQVKQPRPVPTAQVQQQPAQAAPEMTWADAKKRFANEYGADVRQAVNDRFKNQEDKTERLNEAMETLAAIAPFYGVDAADPAQMDLGKLKDSIAKDKRWYEQAALEKGIPVETEMHVRQLEMEQKRREAENRRSLEREMLNKHLENLRAQEAEFKKEFPDFDLMAEIQANPAFARMTSPGGGLNVKQAYMALHGDELMQRVSQASSAKAQNDMSRAIQSGAMRPQENGMNAQGGGIPARDYNAMTRQDWRDIRRRAQRGEKIAIT